MNSLLRTTILTTLISVALLALPLTSRAATIQGVTFIDGNNNGLKDQGEPSLTATLFLRKTDFIAPKPMQMAITHF